MSEYTPSSIAGDVACEPGQALTPQAIEAVLQEFRGWLEQAAAHSAGAEPPPPKEPEFSWHALVAEFTALRQEVNLQTRAARAQLEQNAQALEQLGDAAKALKELDSDEDEAEPNDESVRPLLKTIVEVYDALALARREVQRIQTTMGDMLEKIAGTHRPGSEHNHQQSSAKALTMRKWWKWWAASVEPKSPDNSVPGRQQAADQVRHVLSSVFVGYTMGLQRLERALAQHDVTPLDCVGKPFDPESMEVVEVVVDSASQGTVVLEEVRRGYHWRGRLFRPAQVRVSRP